MQELQPPKVKSLAKALHLLECFTTAGPELGISDLAALTGLNKSNVHNLVSTFEQSGYIRKTTGGKYALGLKMLEFAFIINQNLGYPNAVYDILTEVANQVNEVVYFGVPHGTNVLYLYVAHPAARFQALPYREMLGEKAPLYCTGIGKAILAFLPEEEWEARLPECRRRFTPNTILDQAAIFDELRLTRRRGYSIDNIEREANVRCVGVPIFNTSGQLVAGMSASGPAMYMTDEKLLECSRFLTSAALKMRKRIYHRSAAGNHANVGYFPD